MDRVVEQSDGVAEKTADNFDSDQTKGGNHCPPENGRLQGGMHVRMIVAVMRVTGKAVPILVRRFRGIAGLGFRSLRLRVHLELV